MNKYNSLASALSLADIPVHPSEAHGIMTGALCANAADDQGKWLGLILGTRDPAQQKAFGGLVQVLVNIYASTRAALNDPDFSNNLLLPDDAVALDERIYALACWSQGFLLGLAEHGVKDAGDIGGEAGEFLQDVQAIAEAAPDVGSDEETEERLLSELVEYLRVGSRLVYEDLNPVALAGRAGAMH